jgi:septal ring factor EnvC (AmiA/AmiB activator)
LRIIFSLHARKPGVASGAWLFCFLSLLGLTTVCSAKTSANNPAAARLKQLESQAAESRAHAAELQKRTEQIEKDLTAQRQSLTEAAAKVRASEESLLHVEAEQSDLSAQYSQESFFLGKERAKLARLTTGLIRLARIPPGALLAGMDSPIDAARAQMIIAAAITETNRNSEQLEHEITLLDDLGRDLDAKRREVARVSAQLIARQSELAAMVGKRQSLYLQTDAERKAESERAEKIAGEAQDLRDLMARVEAEEKARQALEARRKTSARPAALPQAPSGHFATGGGFPVAGQIKIRFGQNDGLGATSHGITLISRPGATVTAPAAGIVRFAGPFRGYREILILEHPGGYHSLIAGMARINVAVGTSVGAGEPVGTMDEKPDAKPELYYELRRNGQFVDPQTVAAGK